MNIGVGSTCSLRREKFLDLILEINTFNYNLQTFGAFMELYGDLTVVLFSTGDNVWLVYTFKNHLFRSINETVIETS